MKKLIFILILVLISGCMQDKYSQELRNKQTASDTLAFDDIFPKELAGYSLIDESREKDYAAQYGNFEYDGSYRMLKEGDVLIEIRTQKYDSYKDMENADKLIQAGNKYYYKSKIGDYEYLQWYNNGWGFTLVDSSYNVKDDSIVFNVFKELKY